MVLSWKKFLTCVKRCEGGETMEQVAQRGCGCPLQGGVPAYIRMLEVGDLKGLFQTKPLYDSTQAFGKETDEYNLGAADENPPGLF